ncbi:MAG: GIY-YIG nuclease family protein [Patescibacteria group bacterium]
MPFYYTYVLKNKKDGSFYIGWSDNLKQRLKKHNLGLVKSTRTKRPLKVVYFEACLSKTKAVAREKQLKTGFGRAYLKRRLV